MVVVLVLGVTERVVFFVGVPVVPVPVTGSVFFLVELELVVVLVLDCRVLIFLPELDVIFLPELDVLVSSSWSSKANLCSSSSWSSVS